MPQLDLEKFSAVIGMLGSEMPGEALNARDAAQAMLRRAGLSWADLKTMVRPPQANGQRAPDPPRYGGGDGNVNRLIIELQDRVKSLERINLELNELLDRKNQIILQARQDLAAKDKIAARMVNNYEARLRRDREVEDKLNQDVDRLNRENGELRRTAGEPGEDWALSEVEISRRLFNALRYCGITTLRAAAALSKAELMRIPNLGKRSYRELRLLLVERSLWGADAPP